MRNSCHDIPEEFLHINPEEEYIWSFKRFEAYVNQYADTIRKKLGDLSREEMLDALCFGNFHKHKEMCIRKFLS